MGPRPSGLAPGVLGDGRQVPGPEFDIHGGGLDLRFPHHENEQAQSRAAGDGFAQYWMHNGWVTLGGEKMSKSLGNTALVDEVVKRVRPVELRYYLVAPHYRSMIEFTDAALDEAAAGYRRIESFVQPRRPKVASGRRGGRHATAAAAPPSATRWTTTSARPRRSPPCTTPSGRATPRSAEGDDAAAAAALGAVRAHARRPRPGPVRPAVGGRRATSGSAQATDGLVALALEQRQAARARKDFAAADAIRDRLTTLGVSVEDTPDGPRWELSR